MIPLLLGAAWAGPARLAALADYGSADEQRAHARRAAVIGAKVPGRPARGGARRALAWQVVGRLQVDDPAVIDGAIAAFTARSNPPEVRVAAAYALGELGRRLPWDDRSRRIAGTLLDAMASDLDPAEAYAVIEAFGKVYPQHDHSVEEDLAAARGLNALAARQTAALPGIYYVVQERVLSMEVAVRLLADVVAAARTDRSEVAQAEAYDGALSMVRWLGARQAQLADTQRDRQVQIGAAFDGLTHALALEDRRIVRMVAWSLGEIAQEPAFADLVAGALAPFARDPDPATRALVAGSLAHLDAAAPARAALRDAILAGETDDRLLRLLAALTAGEPGSADVIQRVYDLEAR